jgi:hypothetical protein
VREERYEHAARCRDRSRDLRARWEELAGNSAPPARPGPGVRAGTSKVESKRPKPA